MKAHENSQRQLVTELAMRLALALKAIAIGRVKATIPEAVTRVIEHMHHEAMLAKGKIMTDAVKRERDRQLRAKWKALGICVMCGKKKASVGFVTCEECRAKWRQWKRREGSREQASHP